VCTTEYAPVCADGKTFGNSCAAEAEGYSSYTQGECETVCPRYDMMMPICEEGTFAAEKKDGNGCYSGYECVQSECEVITNEIHCSENYKCAWVEELNQIASKMEVKNWKSLPYIDETNDFAPVDSLGSCINNQVIMCPLVYIEEPKCLKGEVTPIYENGCLVKYQCLPEVMYNPN
jgi:hypothetical protein